MGSDHAGFHLKEELIEWFEQKHYSYVDVGTHTPDSCDYPLIVMNFMRAFDPQKDWGVLICGSGVGVCMAANRYRINRAAVLRSANEAEMGRKHNDLNIACLGARIINFSEACVILKSFFDTEFENQERYARRLVQLQKIS